MIESVKAQLDSQVGANSDLFLYSLVLVMSKLASPWQLIRLAIRAAGSDDAKRIAETPYAVAVQIALEEVDRRVRELAADLKSGRGIAVAALLKEVHDSLRGLRSEINLSPESVWGKQLPRSRACRRLEGSDRRDRADAGARAATDPAAAGQEIVRDSRLDAGEVAETEALIGFVAACRNLRQRTCHQRGHATHLQRIAAVPRQRHWRAARFTARGRRRRAPVPPVSGRCRGPVLRQGVRQEYASLLTKAAEVASHDHERKAAVHG